MNILLVAATTEELNPFFEKYNLVVEGNFFTFNISNHSFTILITGVGMVAATFHLTKFLSANHSYDLAINAGIAGAFSSDMKIGDVVNVIDEMFGDIGAEDGEDFISILELGFVKENEFPFLNGKLKSEFANDNELKKVSGLTVNTSHGNTSSIEKVKKKFNADVESMEGAAFAFCCAQFKIQWIEIRSISNYIERRDKSKWNIPVAINNLNDWLMNFIETL
ncbi:Futalosine hydrolase [Bacteroidota bacterium]|nr:Futalosine hydrolase [Bacteroidota bacterium]